MPFILSKMRLENFRDLGGIVNIHGQTIKSGLIFRSASLEHLCLRDKRELVKKYHLKHVIDLRTNVEITQKKDKIIKGVTYHHLPYLKNRLPGVTHEHDVSKKDLLFNKKAREDLVRSLPKMKDMYISNAESDECYANSKIIVHQVIDNIINGESTLYHCTAGKDRSGIISALLLCLLDVDLETIIEDYLKANNKKAMRRTLRKVKLLISDKELLADIQDKIEAKRENFMAYIDTVNAKYGSVENFIKGLDVSKEKLEAFKKVILE